MILYQLVLRQICAYLKLSAGQITKSFTRSKQRKAEQPKRIVLGIPVLNYVFAGEEVIALRDDFNAAIRTIIKEKDLQSLTVKMLKDYYK